MAKTIFLLLLSVIYVTSSVYHSSKKWIDIRSTRQINVYADPVSTTTAPITTEAPMESYCKFAGYQCAGCDKVIICYKIDGMWVAEEHQTCSTAEKLTCNAGVCSTVPSRECAGDHFKCKKTEGMYPDPSSCQKFKYCVPDPSNGNLTPYGSKCNKGYAYNAKTTYCDKLLPTDICNGYPVPNCTYPAQTEALKENPTIFYTCLPVEPGSNFLYPVLDACKNGKIYDAVTTKCK